MSALVGGAFTGAPWARGLVVTCEHASNAVPPELEQLFAQGHDALGELPQAALSSHRGYDVGAADVALGLAEAVGTRAWLGPWSRLVVDLNRSAHHPKLFSPVTRALDKQARQDLVARLWQPHRAAVGAAVARAAELGLCLHLAMHSFTPVWQNQTRAVDIGLLYDPKRAYERQLAQALAAGLAQACPTWRVRRNQPYRGVSDGLPTALRRLWPDAQYAGIEIEVNQALVHNRRAWHNTCAHIVRGCSLGLEQFGRRCESF